MQDFIPTAAGRCKSVSHFPSHFAKEFFFDFDPLSASTVAWLNEQGATSDAITSPVALRCGRVSFDPLTESFAADRIGERALIAPVIDGGVIADAVAWSPKSNTIATRFGVGHSVGQGQIGRDGIGSLKPLPVFRDLVGWLRADRCGIVIADDEMAAHALAGLALEAEDAKHAKELTNRLRVAAPRISVCGAR